MQRPKLTNGAIEKFTCRDDHDQDVLWDGEVKGFGMRLSARTGTRTYFLQYRVKGSNQERQVTIGRHNDPYRVEQARAEALRIKAKMLGGVDPVVEAQRIAVEKQEQAKVDVARTATLQQCLDSYIAHKRTKHGELRSATKADMRRSIESNLKNWLNEPIAGLTRDKCLARFVELSNRAPAVANLTFVYLRAVCNHARDLYSDEQGNYTILATNPVTRMLKIRKLNKEKPRTRRIALERVGHGWLALQRLRQTVRTAADRTAVDLVCTRFLTALRLTESGSLRWSQIDLDRKAIRLLGEVGKTHQDVTLPMSTALHDLLSERAKLPRITPNARVYVFPSPNERSPIPYMRDPDAVMKTLAKATGCVTVKDGKVKCALSSHDFRRTLEDVAKAVKIDPDDRRKLLGHLASDVHGLHYDNTTDPEALRPAVEAIARYITHAATVAAAADSETNEVPCSASATVDATQ